MTTANLPSIETLISAATLEKMQRNIKQGYSEIYQPILDDFIQRIGAQSVQGEVVAKVETTVALDEDGEPGLVNDVKLDVEFTPERTYDTVENVQRQMVLRLFKSFVDEQQSVVGQV